MNDGQNHNRENMKRHDRKVRAKVCNELRMLIRKTLRDGQELDKPTLAVINGLLLDIENSDHRTKWRQP